MSHLPAIKIIESRIKKLREVIEEDTNVMVTAQMQTDYFFAKSNIENTDLEIKHLQISLKTLVKDN